MASRLNIVRRERQCSQCEEPGHTRRTCGFTTIDEYCNLRNNAEFFHNVPLFNRRPVAISVTNIREFRQMILGFAGEEGENLEEEEEEEKEEEKVIKLFYFHLDNENITEVRDCGICLDDVNICRMTKLNCGHNFCDKCTDSLITKEKSCCALCRAEITCVEVFSGESYGLLKDNSTLSTF